MTAPYCTAIPLSLKKFLFDWWRFRELSDFFCLSVCLSVTFMHCAQTAKDTDSPVSIPDSFKIRLTSVNSFLPKFCDPRPVDLSVGDIQRQIAAEWLETSQWSQWTAYRKSSRSFELYHRWPPTISLSSKMWVPRCSFLRNYFGHCWS